MFYYCFLLLIASALAFPYPTPFAVAEGDEFPGDITWNQLIGFFSQWVSEQHPQDKDNINAFCAKVVKIYENFQRTLEENQNSLTPQASDAARKIIVSQERGN